MVHIKLFENFKSDEFEFKWGSIIYYGGTKNGFFYAFPKSMKEFDNSRMTPTFFKDGIRNFFYNKGLNVIPADDSESPSNIPGFVFKCKKGSFEIIKKYLLEKD